MICVTYLYFYHEMSSSVLYKVCFVSCTILLSAFIFIDQSVIWINISRTVLDNMPKKYTSTYKHISYTKMADFHHKKWDR